MCVSGILSFNAPPQNEIKKYDGGIFLKLGCRRGVEMIGTYNIETKKIDGYQYNKKNNVVFSLF